MKNETTRFQLQKRSLFITISLLTLAFTLQIAVAGQQEPQQRPNTVSPAEKTNPANVLALMSEEYKIGIGDVIEIQVDKAPELSGTFYVSSKGTILMQFLGNVVAHQKTPEELGSFIGDSLRGRYLTEPHVVVLVRQFNSRSFFILGAVRSPGVYQIVSQTSLLTLITMAGGLGDNHGSTAFIIRPVRPQTPAAETGPAEPLDDDSEYEFIKANIAGLLKGNFEQNVTIKPGDIINIPPSDVFFVAGEVNAPGSFPLKDGTTLRQAISLAQGTTFEANKNGSLIFRDDPLTGKREEIKIDIGAVMSGKKEDVALLANDVIIVPHSRAKSIGGTLLRAFGMGALRGGARIPRY